MKHQNIAFKNKKRKQQSHHGVHRVTLKNVKRRFFLLPDPSCADGGHDGPPVMIGGEGMQSSSFLFTVRVFACVCLHVCVWVCICVRVFSCFQIETAGRRCCCLEGRGARGMTATHPGWSTQEGAAEAEERYDPIRSHSTCCESHDRPTINYCAPFPVREFHGAVQTAAGTPSETIKRIDRATFRTLAVPQWFVQSTLVVAAAFISRVYFHKHEENLASMVRL